MSIWESFAAFAGLIICGLIAEEIGAFFGRRYKERHR